MLLKKISNINNPNKGNFVVLKMFLCLNVFMHIFYLIDLYVF